MEEIEAHTGTLKIFDDKIQIERNGLLSMIAHGPTEKEIRIENISAINTTDPPFGAVEFEINGEVPNNSGGIFLGKSSDSSILFHDEQKQDRVIELLRERMGIQSETTDSRRSPKERLQDLEELREDGLLSEEEYRSKRSEIVDGL